MISSQDVAGRLAGLFATLGLAVCAAHAQAPDVAYMGRLMFEAHQRGQRYPDLIRINPTLADEALYAVQQRFVALRLAQGEEIGGYKGGFIPKAPVGGVLFKAGLLAAPAEVRLERFQDLLIEAEIAFEFCAAVTAPLPDVAALQHAVCRLAPAIELPDAALPDLEILADDLPHLRRTLIPTDISAKEVLLGTARPARGIDVNRLNINAEYDGKPLGSRDGSAAQDDLWAYVLWVVNDYVLKRGYRIEPGHIVIPGQLTGVHPGKPGGYRVDYGALGTVEFTVVP